MRRYLRAPKGFLLVTLVALLVLAAPNAGLVASLATVFTSVVGAALPEAAIVRLKQGRWRIPSSAILTGLIIGMILSPEVAWYVGILAGIIATASKQFLRIGRSHIFNPAAVGLLAAYAFFSTGQSWGSPTRVAGTIRGCRVNRRLYCRRQGK